RATHSNRLATSSCFWKYPAALKAQGVPSTKFVYTLFFMLAEFIWRNPVALLALKTLRKKVTKSSRNLRSKYPGSRKTQLSACFLKYPAALKAQGGSFDKVCIHVTLLCLRDLSGGTRSPFWR